MPSILTALSQQSHPLSRPLSRFYAHKTSSLGILLGVFVGVLSVASLVSWGVSAKQQKREDVQNKISIPIEWVTLPAGRFMMGCVEGDQDCEDDEKGNNRRRESISRFALMKTEVTVDMYKSCVDAGKCEEPDAGGSCNWDQPDRGNHPVNCVDWDHAVQYCGYVGGRLPSAAEWEYAAKSGGKNQKYPWGNEKASCVQTVMDDGGKGGKACGKDRTWPVCSRPNGNSAQGICDLSGNVTEWVHDRYDVALAKDELYRNGNEYRGGSWTDAPSLLRASDRGGDVSGSRGYGLGFRCAR